LGAGAGGFGAGAGAASSGGGGGGLGAGGDIFVMQGATLTIDGGSLSDGAVHPGAGNDGGAPGEALGAGIFLQGNETITFSPASGVAETISDVIADQGGAGSLTLDGPGTLRLDADNTYAGGTTIQSGTLEIGAGGSAGTGAITFAGAGELRLDDGAPANLIDNFNASDRIDFAGAASIARPAYSTDGSGNLVVRFDAEQNGEIVSEKLTFSGMALDNEVTLTADGAGGTFLETTVPCYVAGTRILTTRGEIAVEDLRVGDLVVTASGGRRPVVWLGHRKLDPRRHPAPDEVRPVRIAARAFGEGLPRRDLWVSPGHSLACEGALIPASALLNGVSLAQVDVESVTYWHVELDAHDVILAEGLPAESYLDTGNRTDFANGGAFIAAHPDFRPRNEAQTCLPLSREGPAVRATKARLLARLAEAGRGVTTDADAHVRVDGQRVEPIWLNETRLAFVLPAGGRDIALRSRAFVPAHMMADSDDRRSLGLCVGALQIDGSPLAVERLGGSGWHESEWRGETFQHRWTTGSTPLPAGSRLVIVDLANAGTYGRETEGDAVGQTLAPPPDQGRRGLFTSRCGAAERQARSLDEQSGLNILGGMPITRMPR
jgi:autotransporter-associated beta strand protein